MTCSGCKNGPPSYTHTITVEKPGTTEDDNGQVDPSDSNWSLVGQIRARFVTPNRTAFSTRSGREVQVGHQQQAIGTMVIFASPGSTARQIPGHPDWRLKWTDRTGTRKAHVLFACQVNEIGRGEIQIEAMERRQP